MRKPFHTFLSGNDDIQNNVFYSGALNSQIKNILLSNVKDLFDARKEDLAVSKKVYAISAECLDKLSLISKNEKSNGNNPVLFNLLKDLQAYRLSMGIVIDKKDSSQLKKILDDLRLQPEEDTRKKFFEKLAEEKKSEHLVEPVLSLMTVAIKSNRMFSHQFDSFNERELFLTLKIDIEY